MRLLVFGSGLLGGYMARAAPARNHQVVLADLRPGEVAGLPVMAADITRREEVEGAISAAAPDCVILTAAYTSVDGCEKEREASMKVNGAAPGLVAEACRAAGVHLIHISTDYVFDGRKGMYGERDRPAPASHYGRTKLEGERRVAAVRGSHAIARTSALYGWSPAKQSFASWVVAELRAGRPVNLYTDQYTSPTHAGNLAECLIALAGRRAKGVFHAAGGSRASRYGFGLAAAGVFGLDPSLVRPVTTAERPQPAARPPDSSLSVRKVEEAAGVRMLTSEEGLRRMRDEEKDFNGPGDGPP